MIRLLLILVLLAPGIALAELAISDARIKHLPPSVPVRAGYLVLHNSSDQSIRIESVSSDAFANVEIHRSVMQDGMMRMDAIESLEIPAQSSLELAPGGYHLMMMQPVEPTEPGEIIDIVLHFDDGSQQRLPMTVVK